MRWYHPPKQLRLLAENNFGYFGCWATVVPEANQTIASFVVPVPLTNMEAFDVDSFCGKLDKRLPYTIRIGMFGLEGVHGEEVRLLLDNLRSSIPKVMFVVAGISGGVIPGQFERDCYSFALLARAVLGDESDGMETDIVIGAKHAFLTLNQAWVVLGVSSCGDLALLTGLFRMAEQTAETSRRFQVLIQGTRAKASYNFARSYSNPVRLQTHFEPSSFIRSLSYVGGILR